MGWAYTPTMFAEVSFLPSRCPHRVQMNRIRVCFIHCCGLVVREEKKPLCV